jgi:hypothetical protein
MDTKTHKASIADTVQVDRRNFLEKAGKLAAYTPPLMLGLLLPGQHAIASGNVVVPPPGC